MCLDPIFPAARGEPSTATVRVSTPGLWASTTAHGGAGQGRQPRGDSKPTCLPNDQPRGNHHSSSNADGGAEDGDSVGASPPARAEAARAPRHLPWDQTGCRHGPRTTAEREIGCDQGGAIYQLQFTVQAEIMAGSDNLRIYHEHGPANQRRLPECSWTTAEMSMGSC